MASKNILVDEIRIVGARENNLQDLSLSLPKRQVIALAGVSGAGKTTLAHHILARIARRRLGRLRGEPRELAPAYEPRVDKVEGLPPCIELLQEPLRGQSRSTVATYTGLLDLLAGLFLHHGRSLSPGGELVVPVKSPDVGRWFLDHYKGQTISLAEIRPDLTVTSSERLPSGTFYFREKRTDWKKATRASARSALPARWWIAEPRERIRVENAEDADRLANADTHKSLWIIGDTLLDGSLHRVAADDAVPYEQLSRRLFSFNVSGSGGGQCPACAGLGVVQGVNEKGLVRAQNAPLLSGGLNLPQSSSGRFTHLGVLDDILRGLFHIRKLSADVSWNKLSPALRQTVMWGSGAETIPELARGETRLRSAKRPFLGIIPLILMRSRSTGPASKVFQQWIAETACTACGGSRFNRSARACEWRGHSLAELVSERSIGELHTILQSFSVANRDEADLLRSLVTLLAVYTRLNLSHLPLNRATSTLSGGEAQRLKLGLGLALEIRDACYIIDEPSRGLHAQDIGGLSEILCSLPRDENTVIMVEHQPLLLQHADYVVTLGPGGGSEGGRIVSKGPPSSYPSDFGAKLLKSTALPPQISFVEVQHLTLHNLREVTFRFPSAHLTAVVGVSGAGKSSAILRALVPVARGLLEGAGDSPTCRVQLPKGIRFVEVVGQKLVGQNRRSIVATVIEAFDPLRLHFASQPTAKALDLSAAHFSFNSLGACSICAGSGMARDGFDEETDTRCHACGGSRFSGEALLVRSGGKTLAELLDIPVADLARATHPAFDTEAREKLTALVDLGLGHLALGRATPTLSAGERQRLALARFLARLESTAGTGLLILDEPTAGLSVSDARRVFDRIQTLTRVHRHTAVVLEHKLELLPLADWILEFGPGGGPAGGRVIFQGSPFELSGAETPTSTAWKYRSSKRSDRTSRVAVPQSDDVPWDLCADVFESLATRAEVRDDVSLIRPVRPAVRLSTDRFPDDTRVGELLDLLSWLRKKATPLLPDRAFAVSKAETLAASTAGHAFGFSPVAPQLSLGLAAPSDLQRAVRVLGKLGFRAAIGPAGPASLLDLPSQIKTADELSACLVLCPIEASEPLRATALRWSEGVVHLVKQTHRPLLTTQFITNNAIGVDLDAPFVGDCRSPQGRCAQCLGSGRLPTYPWDLIVADERFGIANDKFWNPAVLDAIRSLRRSRLLPEATFFAKQLIADFNQPPSTMAAHTRLLFEHGIPWRHFPKPAAHRIDREQDYYAWRGLHDYVYLVLGRIKDAKHKQRLKDGFQELLCPSCEGTGMRWEADQLRLNGRPLRKIWRSTPLEEWKSEMGCSEPALTAALDLGLGQLHANDRYSEVPDPAKEALLVALVQTASLTGLAVIADLKSGNAKKLVESGGMRLILAAKDSESV